MTDIFGELYAQAVVPVVKIDDASSAAPLADALTRGGLHTAEVTFRTPAAADAITAIKREAPGMLVGAGTILDVEQAKTALDRGASFIVSPGLNMSVVEYCLKSDVPVIPGAVTPTEIENARALGLRVLKFFPAQIYGGLAAIKALSAPYPDVRFMPTGGVSPENLLDYLTCPAVFACGGSYMVKDIYIQNKDFAKIEELTRKTVEVIRAARGTLK